MKVALVNYIGVYPFHGFGGAEKYIYSLASHLRNLGIDVTIVSSAYGQTRYSSFDGIRYVFLPGQGDQSPSNVLLFSTFLTRFLLRTQFDILHSFTGATWGFELMRKITRIKTRTIIQPFGLDVFLSESFTQISCFRKVYTEFIFRLPWRICLSESDRVAAETPLQHAELAKLGVKENRIFDLPQGVDLKVIDEALKRENVRRSEVGISTDDYVVISVNRFDPDRGLLDLVDAFEQVHRQLPHSKLILVGKASLPREIAYYGQVINRIRILGLDSAVIVRCNLDERSLYGWYKLADVFVSPTLRSDPILMSIQEAMACNLPIISTSSKILVHDGFNGYTVPKHNPRILAAKIIEVHDKNLSKTFGANSRRIVSDLYDYSRIAKMAFCEYARLLGGC